MIKKLGKRILKDVPENNAFWLKTDHYNVITQIRNLNDFAKEITKAPTAAIVHHLREGRNDFADWIEFVVGDKVLSEKLRKIKAKNWKSMQKEIVFLVTQRIKQIKA